MDAVRFQWPARTWESTTAATTLARTNLEQAQDRHDGLGRNCNDGEDNRDRAGNTKRPRPPLKRRRITNPTLPVSKSAAKKTRSKVDKREKLGQKTARRNAAIAHHQWEEKEKATPSWSRRLFGPSPQPENLPLRGRATRTMKRYYPTKTIKYSTKPQPPPHQIDILSIATNILPEVHRELTAHYYWIQRNVARTLPKNIATYVSNHPEYSNWTEPDLTKEHTRLVHEHLATFTRHATPHLESIKISVPGEAAAAATLTSTAIALVALRTYIAPDASEEAKRTKIMEIQRLGISNHRAHVKAYMHLWSDRVAELRDKWREAEKEKRRQRETGYEIV